MHHHLSLGLFFVAWCHDIEAERCGIKEGGDDGVYQEHKGRWGWVYVGVLRMIDLTYYIYRENENRRHRCPIPKEAKDIGNHKSGEICIGNNKSHQRTINLNMI